jgi:hypothetical protein
MASRIQDLKTLIALNNLEGVKHYINELLLNDDCNGEELMDPAYIFQKVYLHACLLKRHEIATYLEKECFPLLPEIQQIAIRQCFSYGRVLLAKK